MGLFLGSLLVAASLLAAWLQPVRIDATEQPSPGQAAWWLHPLERHPQLRLPRVTGDLADVFALPGTDKVWAVRQKGLILHAEDGRNWRQQHPRNRNEHSEKPTPPSKAYLPELISTAHAVDATAQRALIEPPEPERHDTGAADHTDP
jgi:hypothetical protein